MSSVFIRIVMNFYKVKEGNLVAKRLLEMANKTPQSFLPASVKNVQEKCLSVLEAGISVPLLEAWLVSWPLFLSILISISFIDSSSFGHSDRVD